MSCSCCCCTCSYSTLEWCTAPLWKIYCILRYFEKELMHQIFVIGLFRNWRQRGVRSEQNLAEIENLGPITLTLDNQPFTCQDGSWSAGPGIPRTAMGIHREIDVLRRERKHLKREVAKYARKTEELKGMKDKINMLDFKYQLLLDMVRT
ncbi:hypothetical protein SELMODRAFT_411549 [Selaginella moellendorffii]|uniref:Uncharacterized protein n=1 Tax=Selaginella moellendorffii TaxID=88036 RepID=D8RIA4_SELML|nr:hypothetical protein SELMODRAFT_411549 [Selaginella moellendorffii]